MQERLTKAQVEDLMVHIGSSPGQMACALAEAVEALHGTPDVAGVLDSLGRHHDAAGVRAEDEAVLWALATELNERRRL